MNGVLLQFWRGATTTGETRRNGLPVSVQLRLRAHGGLKVDDAISF